MAILKIRDENGKITEVLAIKGENGVDGHTPVKGTDYWTEEDKQELANDIANRINVGTDKFALLSDFNTLNEEVINARDGEENLLTKLNRVVTDYQNVDNNLYDMIYPPSKNILRLPEYSISAEDNSGVSITINENLISVEGTAAEDVRLVFPIENFVLPAGTYSYAVKNLNSDFTTGATIYIKDDNYTNISNVFTNQNVNYNKKVFTIAEDKIIAHMSVTVTSGTEIKQTFNLQLEAGETSTDYVSPNERLFGGELTNDVDTLKLATVTASVFGAVGDGETDDTDALQRAIDYCSENYKVLKLESGKKYLISKILQFNGKSIYLDGNFATIKANKRLSSIDVTLSDGSTKSISPMIYVDCLNINDNFNTTLNEEQNYRMQVVKNLIIDCNGVVNDGIRAVRGRKVHIDNIVVINPVNNGIIINTGGWENMISNIHVSRYLESLGGTGIYIEGSDNVIDKVVVIGCQYGVINVGGDNHYSRVHPWSTTKAMNNLRNSVSFGCFGSYCSFNQCMGDSTNRIFEFKYNARAMISNCANTWSDGYVESADKNPYLFYFVDDEEGKNHTLRGKGVIVSTSYFKPKISSDYPEFKTYFSNLSEDEEPILIDKVSDIKNWTNAPKSIENLIESKLDDTDGVIKTKHIAEQAITTERIAAGSVTTSKIANDSVSNGHLMDNSVNENKIADGAVTESKLANLSITAEKIANNAVTTDKIGLQAVTFNKIAENAVLNKHIANGSVKESKIADGAVTKAKLSDELLQLINSGGGSSGGATVNGDSVPDYWVEELEAKADAIQTAMEKAGRNKSAFLWYTDAHWANGNSKVSPSLLNYLYMNTPMNKVNFGGDIIGNSLLATREEMKYLYEWRKAIKNLPNHHSVLGNHDMFSSDSVDYEDDNYRYTMLIAPEESSDMVMGNGNYYYIDNHSEKTRYLYLCYPNTVQADLMAQGEFIVNALKTTPENWHIVVISHRWFQYSSSSTPTTGVVSAFEKDILSVFDAYNARVTRSGSNYFYAQDFTDAKAKVEFCIGGHIHVDYDFTSDGGIPVIITTADANQNRVPDSTVDSGTIGTTTEAAVYGIIADYNDAENIKITVVGVGRGTSRVVRNSNVKLESISNITYSGDTTVGMELDITKFSFTANYSNGSSEVVTGATSVNPTTVEVVGDNTVTITYTEGVVTVSGTITIVGTDIPVVNLFDKNDSDIALTGRFNSSNAVVNYAEGQLVTGYIEGKVGDVFTLVSDKANNTNGYTGTMMMYDSNKNPIANMSYKSTANNTVVSSDDYKTVVFNVVSSYPGKDWDASNTAFVRFCVAYTDIDSITITKS